MVRLRIIISLLFFMITSIKIPCKEIIEVKNVKGFCEIKNISPEEAKSRAIIEAEKEALRKAKITEQISVSGILITNQDDQNFYQIFNEISTVEINGAIFDYDVVNEVKYIDKNDNWICEVEIDAKVIKYNTKKDPSFNFKVDGIKKIYQDGDVLNFSIEPSQNGYLKIFNFNDSNCILLYPFQNKIDTFLNDEEEHLFKKNQLCNFPVKEFIGNNRNETGYTLEVLSEDENNYIVIVFTKQYLPFIENVNIKNILKWIYSIPPDQREVKYFQFIIKK
ncbi:MAG: hypothetical protein A2X61_13150 [Ignavibacteria bacterium GWB2_35_12]|nr:MAG: hypothetical protein A2X61_13150 [Ignavibacteria bacterium GWB2_35_12]OGU95026.1 MAG: hypothetical protein A2220_09695 [Ignavibacteria bacterium RIFOXYA2_FULL_35_10]OGV19416.1 MAG: hypothetical protein A2475_04940 [Ignavibacteria bacterium RIFOXYC2_FULL_35_21]